MVEQETKKLDRRVVKTKKAIRNSFLKLLTEKDIDKVTVKEIADGMRISESNVSVILHRTRSKFKDYLTKEGICV